jgi:quercetin dioxygenase-like cupin family protein
MYGMVIKWPPHTGSRPHSHPNARYITVLSGTWWVNTGAKYSPETMVPMKPGAFIVHTAGEIHYDGTKDEPAMIYIVGMGPAPIVDREQK